ncbi:MAG: radical SAM protein, partial [Syntrophorhabdales bacterium]
RRQWEPGAAPLDERTDALRRLSEEGFRTWVSMEPWVHPVLGGDDDVGGVLSAIPFANRIVFGRLNYRDHGLDPREVRAYYADQAQKVIAFCTRRGIDCHVKRGTMQ